MNTVLALEGLSVTYRRRAGLFGGATEVKALSDVSLHVEAGECVGIIGESGCGKSTLAGVAAGLIDAGAGRVRVAGELMPRQSRSRPLAARRALQLVFQDPYGSLDPRQRIGAIIAEGLTIHAPASNHHDLVMAVLGAVGLSSDFIDRLPHQLSGGQRQRVAMARALVVEPKVIILDEPTSALDLSVQAQILNLLLDLQAARGLGYLLISHDIDVIRHLCHRVIVMAAGRIVEAGPTADVLGNPHMPYTQRLIAAAPSIPGLVA
ncbi:ATP-binding cassette domain-containing protein [Novosphingobium sp.]|uniref:ATP-binding cassette domain-containing protein n=1 Tax=Novosphingobium sp. TaxID=1874826 RepID=UPI003BA9EEDC